MHGSRNHEPTIRRRRAGRQKATVSRSHRAVGQGAPAKMTAHVHTRAAWPDEGVPKKNAPAQRKAGPWEGDGQSLQRQGMRGIPGVPAPGAGMPSPKQAKKILKALYFMAALGIIFSVMSAGQRDGDWEMAIARGISLFVPVAVFYVFTLVALNFLSAFLSVSRKMRGDRKR